MTKDKKKTLDEAYAEMFGTSEHHIKIYKETVRKQENYVGKALLTETLKQIDTVHDKPLKECLQYVKRLTECIYRAYRDHPRDNFYHHRDNYHYLIKETGWTLELSPQEKYNFDWTSYRLTADEMPRYVLVGAKIGVLSGGLLSMIIRTEDTDIKEFISKLYLYDIYDNLNAIKELKAFYCLNFDLEKVTHAIGSVSELLAQDKVPYRGYINFRSEVDNVYRSITEFRDKVFSPFMIPEKLCPINREFIYNQWVIPIDMKGERDINNVLTAIYWRISLAQILNKINAVSHTELEIFFEQLHAYFSDTFLRDDTS